MLFSTPLSTSLPLPIPHPPPTHADTDDSSLTWADFNTLFRPLLVHGFTMIKHGRSGGAKKRRFWFSGKLDRMYWDSSKFLDVALGTGERYIAMSSVVQIVDGIGTDLLRRKMATGQIYPGHQSRMFSLITTERTFDLEASSEAQRRVLVRALSFLLNRGRPAPMISSGGVPMTGAGGGGAGAGRGTGAPAGYLTY